MKSIIQNYRNIKYFNLKGKNKINRTENHKIKVTIEVDMVCGVV